MKHSPPKKSSRSPKTRSQSHKKARISRSAVPSNSYKESSSIISSDKIKTHKAIKQIDKAKSNKTNRFSDNFLEISDKIHKNDQGLSNFSSIKVQYVQVNEDSEGQRLDNFLVTFLKGVPKTLVYRIIRKGEVRVNKGRAQPQYRLNVGDNIRIPPVRRASDEKGDNQFARVNSELRTNILSAILYEDDSLLVFNKPSGLASHGGSGLSFGVIELLRHLKPNLKSLELVHRLDRDTSGCLILAKNRKTLLALQEQLKSGQVEKNYLALVKGQWHGGEVVDAPLKKNQLQSGERMVKVHPEGQPSRTVFIVKERFPLATLMLAKPITGRTHQIRVHAASVGNSVAGDLKYTDEAFNREMKTFGLKRLFLHAESIGFILPETNQHVTFEAPMDVELLIVLQKLRGKE